MQPIFKDFIQVPNLWSVDGIIYLVYPLLLVVLLVGAKFAKPGKYNEEFMSLKQSKMLQGFFAICIMLHHSGQKTCASWHNPKVIVHGLDMFVGIGYLFVCVFLFCSGYGLFVSFKNKPDYLRGFITRRIIPIVVTYFLAQWVYIPVRLILGEKMDTRKVIHYLTTIEFANPNTWFPIAMVFFYFCFYFSFKYSKSDTFALFLTTEGVFLYTFLGTLVYHNDYWMRGEWWYQSVHAFWIGLWFAKYAKQITGFFKKTYFIALPAAIVLFYFSWIQARFCQDTFGFYKEFLPFWLNVWCKWQALLAEQLYSTTFLLIVLLLNMKIQLNNKVLAFMGTITFEFYLIHGLFVDMFGFSFADMPWPVHPVYYIRNVALFLLVVVVCSIPSALLLQKLSKFLTGLITGSSRKSKSNKLAA